MSYMTKDSWPGTPSEATEKEKALWARESKLINQCKTVNAFEHEGRIYLGYHVEAVKAFIENNPLPADFSVWLQQRYKEIL